MLYYLSLGSNLGEREQTLRAALQQIEQQIGSVLRCSSFYYSEAWGFDSKNTFCNLCCAVESTLEPLEVLRLTQSIERSLGRTHRSCGEIGANTTPVYSDRPIDIDIIRAFDNDGEEIKCQITNDQSPMRGLPLLTLPHPLWQQREFVTIPLSEIA